MSDQRARAELFGQLHRPGDPLLVLNAWDAGSARIFELAGAKAIATTSVGLAVVHGYPDGEKIPLADLARAVAQITRVVEIPVSVDFETGYGSNPAAVAQAVAAMIDAGAVGINLEDHGGPPEILAEKIRAVREMALRRDLPLFINARTDVFFHQVGELLDRTQEALRRLREYAAAGADGGFVFGLTDAAVIKQIAQESPLPLNVIVMHGSPDIAHLRALGVARISIGGGATYAILSATRRIAQELLSAGTYQTMFEGNTLTYPEINAMFTFPKP